ncbi:MAG TPA: potassium-transporting ATPase subunit KdpA, partial [Thermomonospora sp.]|nr:potassium-transporting ATPase subunit KdpA [Thermomonospora sp.]
IFLILLIPFSLTRTFGRMVGQVRQGYAIAAVMGVLALLSVTLTMTFQGLLTTPVLVLGGTAVAMATDGGRAAMLNSGAHGLTEVLYAFTSASNNNGSAFAGVTVNTVWYDTALGLCMAFGRFLPIVFVLALAGSLARQGHTPESDGTLPTHRPQFVGMVAGVTVVLVALTFLPALALGPLAEGIH